MVGHRPSYALNRAILVNCCSGSEPTLAGSILLTCRGQLTGHSCRNTSSRNQERRRLFMFEYELNVILESGLSDTQLEAEKDAIDDQIRSASTRLNPSHRATS